MLEWLALLFFFLLGLATGSYLNVVIHRFGFHERANPRSECAQCGTTLAWFDLIPVVSYGMLRGRCRYCGSALSLQYPLVEIAVGALFALAYLLYAPTPGAFAIAQFVSLLVFLSASVVVVVYDLKHTLVPLPFVFGALVSAFAYHASGALAEGSVAPVLDGALGALLLFGFFALISLITGGKGMGFGDAYVAGAVGALLGVVGGISAAALGVWSGAAFYLAALFASRIRLLPGPSRVTMKTELPFAPWLFIGAFLVLFTDLAPLGLGQWLSRLLW